MNWIQQNFGAVYVGSLIVLGVLFLIAEIVHSLVIERAGIWAQCLSCGKWIDEGDFYCDRCEI